ncbi:hypothetical protein ACFLYC_03340, partial [Chloroflexota bacterium]
VPASALNITFTPSAPSSGTLGSTYTFNVKVDVENTDLLPVDYINLSIYHTTNGAYRVDCANLPLYATTKSYPSVNGNVNATATPGANWAQGSATRKAYGYGYPSGTWSLVNPLSGGTGYGYSTSPYIGPTSITYTISWSIPSGWPTGTYEILFLVYGDSSNPFTSTTRPTFTVSSPSTGGTESVPGVTSVTNYVTSDGVFTRTVTAKSTNNKVTLTINKDTKGLTAAGTPLREISILEMAPEDIPPPPAGSHVIGLTYDMGPDGATFDPPITLTFNYDPDDIPDGVNEEDLVIAVWDADAGEWVELPCVVDTVNHTITATTSHFTAFSIIAPPVEPVVPPVEPVVPPVEPVVPPVEPVVPPVEPVVPPVEPVVPPVEPVVPPVEEPEAPVEAGIASWVWIIVSVGGAVIIGLLVYFLWWRWWRMRRLRGYSRTD